MPWHNYLQSTIAWTSWSPCEWEQANGWAVIVKNVLPLNPALWQCCSVNPVLARRRSYDSWVVAVRLIWCDDRWWYHVQWCATNLSHHALTTICVIRGTSWPALSYPDCSGDTWVSREFCNSTGSVGLDVLSFFVALSQIYQKFQTHLYCLQAPEVYGIPWGVLQAAHSQYIFDFTPRARLVSRSSAVGSCRKLCVDVCGILNVWAHCNSRGFYMSWYCSYWHSCACRMIYLVYGCLSAF